MAAKVHIQSSSRKPGAAVWFARCGRRVGILNLTSKADEATCDRCLNYCAVCGHGPLIRGASCEQGKPVVCAPCAMRNGMDAGRIAEAMAAGMEA